MMFDQFHFLAPLWWLLVLPLAALVVVLWRRASSADNVWSSLIEAPLLPYLLDRKDSKLSRWPLTLLSLGALITIAALANPVWQQKPMPVFETDASRVIVLDLSLSMYSPDIAPSRIDRAKFKLKDLLAQPYEGQTALVAFAGDAFVVSPLTRDVDTVEAMFDALSPNIMPVQGSRLDVGIETARTLLRQSTLSSGHIIAFTDGGDLQSAKTAAAESLDEGFRVSVIAVGTDKGAPLPNGRGDVVRNRAGEVILPAVDADVLAAVAQAGGGGFARMSADERDLGVLNGVETHVQEQSEAEDMLSDKWDEKGPWLCLLLLPLAALAFRKGWLLSILLPVLLVSPDRSEAADWRDWFRNSEQQAQTGLLEGQFEAALKSEAPQRQAAALYRMEKYQEAAEVLKGENSADAHYNRGNALVRQHRFDEAIAAYDEALAIEPDMQDALDNRALAEQFKQNPPPKQPPSQDQQTPSDQPPSDDQQSNEDASEQPQEQDSSDPSQQGQQQDDAESEEDNEQNNAAEPEQPEDSNDRGQETGELNDGESKSEEEIAADQWLRRIEDDPGELLRRKFLYQYQQRDRQAGSGSGQSW